MRQRKVIERKLEAGDVKFDHTLKKFIEVERDEEIELKEDEEYGIEEDDDEDKDEDSSGDECGHEEGEEEKEEKEELDAFVKEREYQHE